MRGRKFGKPAMAMVLATATATLAIWFFKTHASPPRPIPTIGTKGTIVLADFQNTTGDPVFDQALRRGLAVQLEQSPTLRIVSDESILRVLSLMGKQPDSRLDFSIAREVCERTSSAAVLQGSIAKLGNDYILALQAKDCRTGDVLYEEQEQAPRKEEVLHTLGRIAARFRVQVGESLSNVEQHNTPLLEATTESLDAWKAYNTGWQLRSSAGEAAALPFFRRATEIDPKFAMAYAALGLMYGATGESALAEQATTKAYGLRDATSERERYFISAYYEGRVTGNQEKAGETCEEWARAYPRDPSPHTFLAGFVYPVTGKYEQAVGEAKKAVQLVPDQATGYFLLSGNNIYLGRLIEAEDALRSASQHGIEIPEAPVLRYLIGFLEKDQAAIERQLALSRKTSSTEEGITQQRAFVLAYSGSLPEAMELSQHSADLARQSGHAERAALLAAASALWASFAGESKLAIIRANAARKTAKNREVAYGAGLALALSGDRLAAEEIAKELEKEYPEDTSVNFNYLPTLRAVFALSRGEGGIALAVLKRAETYELSSPRSSLQGLFGALYPDYFRGVAYLSVQQEAAAAAEFKKVIDHPGITQADPVGALALLGLGRAYRMTNQTLRARAAYQAFFDLWKGADTRLPIMQQARREFAKIS